MSKRNGTLDVLRSLAIVMVVMCHTVIAYGPPKGLEVLQLGGKGVDLFFVLSGWLLGHQLLSELKSSGSIDVPRFWLRRWLRTLPAYYAVLALTFAWQVAGRGNRALDWSYLFFGQTYLSDLPYFGVSWSLCVEEHFYLAVAPLLLMFWQHRRARYLLPVLLLLPPICRAMGWYGSLYQTHVRWDQCACGVALAWVAVFRPNAWSRLCRWAPAAALIGLAIALFNFGTRVYGTCGIEDLGPLPWAMVGASGVLLANSSNFWKYRFHPWGMRYLADRSYAIYLLHVEAYAILKHFPRLPFPIYLFLVWAIALGLAELLYRGIERPFMQAREWFSFSCAGHSTAPVPKSAVAPVAEPVVMPAV